MHLLKAIKNQCINQCIFSHTYDVKATLFRVSVKTTPALLAQPASVHILNQQWRGSVLAVAELCVQHTHDGETRVKTDKIREFEGTHRHVGAELHGGVDVLLAASA